MVWLVSPVGVKNFLAVGFTVVFLATSVVTNAELILTSTLGSSKVIATTTLTVVLVEDARLCATL